MLTEVDIDNTDETLFPGMYAVVTFVQARGISPLTVPGDAVVVRQDRNTLAIVKDQKIQLVPVEIGRDYGPSVEILSGIHEGDLVVTTVTDSVQPGVKVRAQQNPQVAQDTGQGGAQTNQSPDAGPDQYGDQSIVNEKSESTNQQKPGAQQPKQSAEPKSGAGK